MEAYSERDLRDAARFRDGIHKEALAKVRRVCPGVEEVVDRCPLEAYFQQHWDYPGQWYTMVSVPAQFKSREALVDAIVRDTLGHYRTAEAEAEPREAGGKKLDAKHYDYEALFTVAVDQETRTCTVVGRDRAGRSILERYEEYNLGSACSSVSDYYVLTETEFRRYAKQALLNGHITQEDCDRLCETGAAACPDDPFYRLIAEYPRSVIDYCIVAGDPLGYRGRASHRRALEQACRRLSADGGDGPEWSWDAEKAKGRRIGVGEQFSSAYQDGKLNYRKAFLYPPHRNSYSGKDFVRINAALFPNGTDCLEAYKWSTDWSDYFDDGHEWWGALCLSVYDKSLDRFAVIMASATD